MDDQENKDKWLIMINHMFNCETMVADHWDCYEEPNTYSKLVCRECGNDQFQVFYSGEHYSEIGKCLKCFAILQFHSG